jgi:hypothetical protein
MRKDTINSYFAILIITIAGAGASLLIIHISNANNLAATFACSEAGYSTMLK